MASTSTTTRPFVRDDLARFPDDGNRYELLDGLVLVTPPPRLRHQDVQRRLLITFVEAGAYVLAAPVEVAVAADTSLQPDLCVWREPFTLERDGPAPTPGLVVEISSPSTRRRDLGPKRERYAATGIAEYWFVDLERAEVRVHRLVDGTYVADTPDTAIATVVPASVTVADLFA